MAKSATFENQVLALIFNGTPIPNLADNAVSSPLANLYLALHSADPTSAGTQSTNEISYSGYARVPVARSSGGWTVTANSVSPAAAINFPSCSGGSATATYASIGIGSTGATEIIYSGALSPTITISNGVIPQINTVSTVTES